MYLISDVFLIGDCYASRSKVASDILEQLEKIPRQTQGALSLEDYDLIRTYLNKVRTAATLNANFNFLIALFKVKSILLLSRTFV